jgi:hypothetical protein
MNRLNMKRNIKEEKKLHCKRESENIQYNKDIVNIGFASVDNVFLRLTI